MAAMALFFLADPVFPAATQKDAERRRQEEQENYFKKWLDEDVVYIITPEERSVFEKLTTAEEKEQFIEQFWFRRDPDPRTAANEFKEEHYRRIAYANERFSSGLPGWLTDRGRIYIIHGPPAEIDSHPSGGNYNRPSHEGGGTTSTYPFETWRYRYIEGIGNDVELEFVDPTLSGEYRLSLNPDEKDALLFVPNAGLTMAESLGLASKKDRPFFSPGNTDYPLMTRRAKDSAFERYETYSQVQRPTEIKYKDLKDIVDVHITYQNLPVRVQEDYFRLNEQRALVPVTVEIENKDLTFALDDNGATTAKVAVYGVVTSITNRVVNEFEDELLATVTPENLRRGVLGRSIYQRVVVLESRGRYKLDLVVKDLRSGNVGVIRKAIVPPSVAEDKLAASSLIFSTFVQQIEDTSKEDQMFVLGNVWIRPSLTRSFQAVGDMAVYLQLYNTGVDQTTLAPSISVNYRVVDDQGRAVMELEDDAGESVQFFSGQRVVLIKQFNLAKLSPGRYTVQIQVRDRIRNEDLSLSGRFEVVPPAQLARN